MCHLFGRFARTGLTSRSILLASLFGLLTLASFRELAAADVLLTLPEAVRLAASRSSQLAAQDAAITAAREMAVSAGQLPDPVLRLGVDNLPVDGADRFSLSRDFMTMRRIGVMQEFPREEKRRLRGERGGQQAELEAENKRVILANVQRDSALAWLDRYYLDQMRSAIDRLVTETQASIEAAEAAYRGGRGSQADVLAARSAAIMLHDRRLMLDRQILAAKIALARWIGTDADRDVGVPPDMGSISLDLGTLDRDLLHHPRLLVLLKQVALAETEVRVAQAAKKPDWSVELAFAQRGPAYSNMVSIGVSVPLPIAPRARQDRDIAARLAMVEQSRAQLEDAVRMHGAEVRAMIAEWQSGRERVVRIESNLVPLTVQRSQAALAAYRGNAGTLAAVLEARRGEIETRLQVLQLASDTARAWAQLNFLLPEHPLAVTDSPRVEAAK